MALKLLIVIALVVCFTFIKVDAYRNHKISLKDAHGNEDEEKLEDTIEVEGFWTRHLSASMSMRKKGLFVDARHRHVKVREAEKKDTAFLKDGEHYKIYVKDEDSTIEAEGFFTRHLSASMSMGKKGLFVDGRHRHVKVKEAEKHNTVSHKDGENYSITGALRGSLASPGKLPVSSGISDVVNHVAAMKEEEHFWQRKLGSSHSISMSYN